MNILTSIMLTSAVMASTFAVPVNAATKHPAHYSEAELKSMDTNQDNMVSKDEFLAYSELSFNKMKLTDGMISLKGKAKVKQTKSDETSSMNNKPIGTTTDNPNVNERDAVNGSNY